MTGRSARNTAMDLLARRDHSAKQLQTKLSQRGFDAQEIDAAIESLSNDNLLNESRFAEAFIRQRSAKGYGPLRIRQELREKGISDDCVVDLLQQYGAEWHAIMCQQRQKKFGEELPEDPRERMKQARFLQNRGFSPESVMRLFRR